jgi:ATP synthase protein I
MDEEADRARLQALHDRLAAAQKAGKPQAHQETHYAQANLAWRMVIELVAGLMIGFGIGYGLDRLFGTLPLFLVLFILAGLAAGIKTMLRSAREVQRREAAEAAEKKEDTRGR